MAEDTPAVPPPSPKKTVSKAVPKKKAAPKPAEHPPYKDMVIQAIVSLKSRKGSSRQLIVKYINANFKGVGENGGKFIKAALRALLASGKVLSTKGQGASGSFKLAKVEKPKAKPKPKAKAVAKKPKAKTATKKPKAKKPAAKKAKKPVAKKAAAKKPAAKKPVAKKAAAKKPKAKKAKSPAKKGKSPAKKAVKAKAKPKK
tara:strand:+ start:2617 stop:3219 length:603 start_codon:yes stop_codon:yes gene_type:complete